MNDQARQLREMVLQEALGHASEPTEQLTWVRFVSLNQEALAGIALNVSLAFARRGVRVALAAPREWHWAAEYGCFELMRDEVPSSCHGFGATSIAMGPWGVRFVEVAPGPEIAEAQWAQLAELVVDLRRSASPQQGHDPLIYVTGTDNASLIDTYAMIKSRPEGCPALLVAYPAETEEAGREALQRIRQASEDRGDHRVVASAVLTHDDRAQLAIGARPPLLSSPKGALSMRLDAVAERFLAERRFVVDSTGT